MRALLDTHAALYAWIEPERLSTAARRVITATENQLYFSQISVLEITLKHRIGKLPLPEEPVDYIPARIQAFALTFLPLENADIFAITKMKNIHKDPFDWLLIGTAQRLKVPIISSDAAFKKYPIKVIW